MRSALAEGVSKMNVILSAKTKLSVSLLNRKNADFEAKLEKHVSATACHVSNDVPNAEPRSFADVHACHLSLY